MGKIITVTAFDGTHLIRASYESVTGDIDYEVAQADGQGIAVEGFVPVDEISAEAHETLLRGILNGEVELDRVQLESLNSREAIIRAAEHLEQHPELYNFFETQVPRHPTDKACALGRVGWFLGMRGATYVDVAQRLGIGWNVADQVDSALGYDFEAQESRWRQAAPVAEWLRSLVK